MKAKGIIYSNEKTEADRIAAEKANVEKPVDEKPINNP